MTSICFVGLDNYPVLSGQQGDDQFGGESVQHTLLAHAMAEQGYSVSMLVKDHGQPDEEVIGEIRVLKTFREHGGLPGLRFLHPRITSILRALKKADADVYYHSCAGMVTGLTAWFCRRHGRRFVFRLAHDSDCIPGEQLIRFWRDRKIYEYGLRRADLIVAQGVRQVELLKTNYRLDSVPLNMAVELPAAASDTERDIDVLWVNNLRAFKRPELAIELARKLPKHRVVMIGGASQGHETLYANCKSAAEQVSNLEFLGRVPYEKVNAYFERAKVFVNTSDQEGFPNSFLQAWARQVPVLSFFDPDGLIVQHSLGAVPSRLDEMALNVQNLLHDDDARRSVGSQAQAFALANYSPAGVAKQYDALLRDFEKN